jgi:transcriptional regulator GlxA family with amidase domain
MMIYIHDHFAEKISVRDLAAAAFLSERECYRVFQNCLHMTPTEYLTSIRLQMACRMLAETRESVTDIGHACGLGSSSYFGKTFREHTGYTPLEYRRKWQDNDKS